MYKALLLWTFFALAYQANARVGEEMYERHEEVVMRWIGHQVLLYSGDSNSLVYPVERQGDVFTIGFSEPFGFQPEVLSSMIDSVIWSNALAKHYIVEFLSCDTGNVIYSYERSKGDSIIPCVGRPQPEACYVLRIVVFDRGEPTALLKADEASSNFGEGALRFVILVIVLFLLAAGVSVRWLGSNGAKQGVLPLGSFHFDPKRMLLRKEDERVMLSGKEADLLLLLYRSMNETVTRDNILKEVWGDDGDYVGRTLDVFISKLRKKIEADPDLKILNIRGVGYKLVSET